MALANAAIEISTRCESIEYAMPKWPRGPSNEPKIQPSSLRLPKTILCRSSPGRTKLVAESHCLQKTTTFGPSVVAASRSLESVHARQFTKRCVPPLSIQSLARSEEHVRVQQSHHLSLKGSLTCQDLSLRFRAAFSRKVNAFSLIQVSAPLSYLATATPRGNGIR